MAINQPVQLSLGALDRSVPLRVVTPTTVVQRTSEWGMRGGKYHHGIDLYAPYGSAVRAAADGRVVASVPNGASGYARYGETIRLAHADGTETLYAHLSRRVVDAGATVRAGQKIGEVGDTRGTPQDPDDTFHYSDPHVHFEVLVGPYPASAGAPAGPPPIRSMNPRAWFEHHGSTIASGQGITGDSRRGFLVFLAGAVLGGGAIWIFKRFRR